jgi:hypothetical protein
MVTNTRFQVPAVKPVFGGPLGVIALAFGVGMLGAYMLDLHNHRCSSCGQKWWHLGAFNLGDLEAHRCRNCGTVQWWKSGWEHVGGPDGAFRKPDAFRPPTQPSQLPALSAVGTLTEGEWP